MDIVEYTATGEPVYESLELPEDFDVSDEEHWSLYDEWNAAIGWSDCRV